MAENIKTLEISVSALKQESMELEKARNDLIQRVESGTLGSMGGTEILVEVQLKLSER